MVELSALREKELAPLVNALDSLDLQGYTYISVRAPSKFEKEQEKEIVDLLGTVASRGWRIVLHPDAIRDVVLWNSFGPLLLIENMDKRNICGRTERELSEIFARLPEAGLCFDIGHCRQVDPTMNEAYLILRAFGRLLFLYARMPGFVLSVCITKPSLAGRTVHGCGIITWLIVG